MRAFLKHSALAFSASSVLFLWVPLYLAHISRNDVNFDLLGSLVVYGSLTVIAGIAFFIIAKLLQLLRLSWVASGLLYFLLFWVTISGFMLPLVEKGGMVSAEDLTTNSNNFIATFILSTLLAILVSTKLKTAIHVFVLVLTVASVGPSIPEIFKAMASAERFTALSEKDNVIVLSLDGISGFVAKNVLDENPELKLAFKDFTLYDNAISLAPATEASIRSELYGNLDYRALASTSAAISKKLADTPNSIQREQAASTDIMTYGAYGIYNTESQDKATSDEIVAAPFRDKLATVINFYRYVGARIGTADTAKYISTEIRTSLSMYLIGRKSERDRKHQGAHWDVDNTFDGEVLVTFTEKAHIKSTPRSVRYLHFLHTHFPVDLDRQCNYRSDDKAWFDSNQNYQGLYNETYCGLQQTADLLNKLKALGIYDKTLFVVKSDHGAVQSYYDTAPQNYAINDHGMWGYDRYRPLLMVKNYTAQQQSMAEDNELVSLGDLARTLCLHSPANKGCDTFKGLDLLNSKIHDTSPHLYLDVVKDAGSDFNFDSQITAEITRDKDFQRALINSGKVVLNNADQVLYTQRKKDLLAIRDALEKYYQANGSYPTSKGLDGLHSAWGRDTANWITGLAPTYMASLPRDPALSNNSTPQYLYQSNGVDYKLMLHGDMRAAAIAKTRDRAMLDPIRGTYAFGYWTTGGRDW